MANKLLDSLQQQCTRPSSDRIQNPDWKIIPFLTPITTPWTFTIPRTELLKLINGFQPQDMDDKWCIYADGPDALGSVVVHASRSWTSFKIVEVKVQIPVGEDGGFKEGKEEARVTEIIWERNPERIRGQTEKEAKELVVSLFKHVLDMNLE